MYTQQAMAGAPGLQLLAPQQQQQQQQQMLRTNAQEKLQHFNN